MKGAVKVVVAIVVIIAAVVATVLALQYRAQVNEYNDAVGLINEGKTPEGIAALEKFYAKSSGSLHEQAKAELVKACRSIIDNPAMPILEAEKWASKINEIDPSALSQTDKQLLQNAAKRKDNAARAATQPAEPVVKPKPAASGDDE